MTVRPVFRLAALSFALAVGAGCSSANSPPLMPFPESSTAPPSTPGTSNPATTTPATAAPSTTAPGKGVPATTSPATTAPATTTPGTASPTMTPPTSTPATPTPVATQGPTAAPNAFTGYYNETNSPNEITSVSTTLTVPAEPGHAGTLFLWPGLDPVDGPNYDPIDNGVLQPVLTWGPSCAPGTQPTTYSTWWVSGQYVNTIGSDPGYTGCQGGQIMSVGPGDTLVETMSLAGSTWNETVLDMQRGTTVTYAIDLQHQMQQVVYFVIEGYGQEPVSSVTFSSTSFTFAQAPSAGCALHAAGLADGMDTYATPVVSNGGLTCSISNITIYSPYPTVQSQGSSRSSALGRPVSGGLRPRRL